MFYNLTAKPQEDPLTLCFTDMYAYYITNFLSFDVVNGQNQTEACPCGASTHMLYSKQ